MDGSTSGLFSSPTLLNDNTRYYLGGRSSGNVGIYCFSGSGLIVWALGLTEPRTSFSRLATFHDSSANVLAGCYDRYLAGPLRLIYIDLDNSGVIIDFKTYRDSTSQLYRCQALHIISDHHMAAIITKDSSDPQSNSYLQIFYASITNIYPTYEAVITFSELDTFSNQVTQLWDAKIISETTYFFAGQATSYMNSNTVSSLTVASGYLMSSLNTSPCLTVTLTASTTNPSRTLVDFGQFTPNLLDILITFSSGLGVLSMTTTSTRQICNIYSVIVPTIGNQIFSFSASTQTYNFPSFSTFPLGAVGTFSYALASTQPACITLPSGSTLSITCTGSVYTSYIIQITGTFSNAGETGTVLFRLTLIPTQTYTLTASSIANQDVYYADLPAQFTFSDFTTDSPTAVSYSISSSVLLTCVSIPNSDTTVEISDACLCQDMIDQTESFAVYGSIASGQLATSNTFSITLKCGIPESGLTDKEIHFSQLPITIPLTYFLQSLTTCTYTTSTISPLPSYGLIDNNHLSLSAASGPTEIFSIDISVVFGSGETFQQQFQLTMVNSAITTTPQLPVTYLYSNLPAQFTLPAFTQNYNFDSFAYEVSGLPSCASWNGLIISIASNCPGQTTQSVSTVTLTGALPTLESDSIQFTLTLNPDIQIILPVIEPLVLYFVNMPQTVSIGTFSTTPIVSYQFTYEFEDFPAGCTTFDMVLGTMTLNCLGSTQQDFTIYITGTLDTVLIFDKVDITLTLHQVSITTYAMDPITLDISQQPASFPFTLFTLSPATATTHLFGEIGTYIGNNFPACISISSSTGTIDVSGCASPQTLTVSITGTLPSGETATSSNFVITLTQITIPSNPLTDKHIDNADIPINILLNPSFTYSPLQSGYSFTYSQNGKPPCSGFNLGNGKLLFSVACRVTSSQQYTITLTATLTNMMSAYSTFTVYFTCSEPTILTSPISSVTYSVGSQFITLNSSQFTYTVSCQEYAFTYTSTLSNGTSLPSFIVFDPIALSYTIYTPFNNNSGTYQIRLIGQLNDAVQSSGYKDWVLTVTESTAPCFSSALEPIGVISASSQSFSLPGIITNTTGTIIISVDLGLANSFATYSNGQFHLNPLKGDSGSYQVTVTLTDSLNSASKTQYTLQIVVLEFAGVNSTYSSHQNSTESNSTNNTSNTSQVLVSIESSARKEAVSIQLKEAKLTEKNNSRGGEFNISCKIVKINNAGLVNIKFIEQMRLNEANLTQFESAMSVSVLKGDEEQNAMSLEFTWSIVNFENDMLSIQLNFTYPLNISRQPITNYARVDFLNASLFQSVNQNGSLPEKYSIKRAIPSQTDSDDLSSFFSSQGQMLSSSMNILTIGNFLVNIFLSASLNYLWGMINCLQLVVYLPLFGINFPSNASFFYSLIVNIANFNVIPTDDVYEWMFAFSDSAEIHPVFESNGFSSNMVENMGTMFLALLAIGVALLFLSILYLVKVKTNRGVKLFNWLSGVLLFNFILRFLIEGYIQQAINAFICVTKMSFRSSSDSFSSVITIAFMAFTFAFPVIVALLLFKLKTKLDDGNIRRQIDSLYIGLKFKESLALTYYVVFLARRLIVAIACVFIWDYPFAQLILFMIQCICSASYIISVKPFDSTLSNKLELFNEICILLIAYHLPLFTDFVPSIQLQYLLGYSIIAFTTLNVAINMLLIIFFGFRSLGKLIKQMVIKLQKKRLIQKKYDCAERSTQQMIKSTQALDGLMGRNGDVRIEEIDDKALGLSSLAPAPKEAQISLRKKRNTQQKPDKRKHSKRSKDVSPQSQNTHLTDKSRNDFELNNEYMNGMRAHVLSSIKSKGYANIYEDQMKSKSQKSPMDRQEGENQKEFANAEAKQIQDHIIHSLKNKQDSGKQMN